MKYEVHRVTCGSARTDILGTVEAANDDEAKNLAMLEFETEYNPWLIARSAVLTSS